MTIPGSRSRLAQLVDPAIVLIATIAAGATFHGAFHPPAVALAVAVAALTPATLLIALWWRPRRLGGRAGLMVVAAGAVLVAGSPLWPGTRESSPVLGWVAAGRGLSSGLWRLYTMTLPAPARIDLVLGPALLIWLCSAFGTAMALSRPRCLVALIAPLALTAAGVFLVGATATVNVLGIKTLAVCAGVMVLRSAPPLARTPAALRGVIAATVAVAITVALGGRLPTPGSDHAPLLAYEVLPGPVTPRPSINPLDQVTAWWSAPQRTVFTAVTDGPVPRWRLTTLDTFDGSGWSSSAVYTPAGLGVPGSGGSGGGPGGVVQHIRLLDHDGPFLPAAERPSRIDAAVTAVDIDAGSLLRYGKNPDVLTYTVESKPAQPDRPRHAPASNPALLEVPASLEADLDRLRARVPAGLSPLALAKAIDAHLHTAYRGAQNAVTSASTENLRRFLAEPAVASGNMIHFAVALVLAMRDLGTPGRLGVGFSAPARPTTRCEAASSQRQCDYSVQGKDARVWAELYFPDRGWVVFSDSPPKTADPASQNTFYAGEAAPRVQAPWDTNAGRTPLGGSASSPAQPRGAGFPWWAALGLAAIIAAALATVYLVALAWASHRRRALGRRRRTEGSPALRVAGAWHEVLDALERRALATRTPLDLTAATPSATTALVAATGVLDEHVQAFVAVVNRALYTDELVTVDAVAQAWLQAERLSTHLRTSVPLHQRMRYAFRVIPQCRNSDII